MENPTSNHPAPQPKRARASLPGLVIVIMLSVLVPLGFSLALINATTVGVGKCQRRINDGSTASAVITRLADYAAGGDIVPDYRAEYRFTAVVNGQPTTINGSYHITTSLYTSLKVGQTIQVIYEVSDPQNSAIVSDVSEKGCSSPPPELTIILIIAGSLIFDFLIILIYLKIRGF
jgi:hypothetical protein